MQKEILKKGPSGLSRGEAIELGAALTAGFAAGSAVEYLNPFDFSPNSENWHENLEVSSNLPKSLRGVSLNAFGAWQYDPKTWDTLFEMMDQTGATILRISSLSDGFFELKNQLLENMAKLKNFFEYFRENATGGVKGGRNFTINFDFCDGYNLFQKGGYNATYTDTPHAQTLKVDMIKDKYDEYYDSSAEMLPVDTTPTDPQKKYKAQVAFYDDQHVKDGFKQTLDYYLTELAPYKDLISAFTLINEAAPVDLTKPKDDFWTKSVKAVASEGKFNQWYAEMLNHIRNVFVYENGKKENRPIILGNADPTVIDQALLRKYGKVILSVHNYPGHLLVMRKVRKLLTDSSLPIIFQEGGVPDKLDRFALFPFLDPEVGYEDIDLPEDGLTVSNYKKIINLAIIDDLLRIGHIGIWGANPKHNDKFRIMPDRQKQLTAFLRNLATVLKRNNDILHDEQTMSQNSNYSFPKKQLIFQELT